MINETFELCRRTVAVRGEENADFLLIQPMGDFEMKSFGTEYEHIKKCGRCIFAAFIIDNWNDELSPWQAKPVWGNEAFGGKAEDTLSFVTTELIPKLKEKYRLDDTVKIVIGGYSLAALFSLWAVYKCDIFYGAAAASPSVWFPVWMEFEQQHPMQTQHIYLSLGDKEEHTKNAVMAAVGDNIRALHSRLAERGADCTLEWNSGGHFKDADLRTAKAFRWVMEEHA